MSEKFTPGPWHVNYSKFSQVKAANGAIVATCNRLSNLVNLQANAHLISAAPEMYEALKTIEWVKEVAGEPPFCPICRHYVHGGHSNECKLGAALKKARGES